MNKENNRSAAGLRRSAIAERLRLREEWSALKEIENDPRKLENQKKHRTRKVLSQKQPEMDKNVKQLLAKKAVIAASRVKVEASEALRGVVALVEVGAEPRALALRAALSALGASVVPQWSPLVTHLIWSEGGSRKTRARARALACQLVSPLWVEACAAAARRLPERAFPAAARASDLPSPRTLRAMLKRAEMENLTLEDLFGDSKDDSDPKQRKLRLSSDTEHDSSTDRSTDKSTDVSDKRDSTDIETRVNTAPRRLLPVSMTPPPEKKSRRKLFTNRAEGEDASQEEEEDEEQPKKNPPKTTSSQRRDLARAERIARKLIGVATPRKQNTVVLATVAPRIVLTGVSRSERQQLYTAIHALKGKIQREVTKKTTHVLLGSCQNDICDTPAVCSNVTGVDHNITSSNVVFRSDLVKARTLKALLGAARGCRVLLACWAADSQRQGTWLRHQGYEVPHLKRICQKARVERSALRKLNSEYAYDVFNGMRVKLTSETEQKDAAKQLLQLCGAVVMEADDIGEVDVTLGKSHGQVNSKWVFDSVAAGRMRTTRRYVVHSDSQCGSFTGR